MEESIEAVLRSARLVRTDAARRARALIDGFPGPAGLTPSPSPSPATSPSPPALMDEPDFDEVICAAEATPQKKHRPARRKKKVAPTDSTADAVVEPAVPYRPKSNSVFDRLSHPTRYLQKTYTPILSSEFVGFNLTRVVLTKRTFLPDGSDRSHQASILHLRAVQAVASFSSSPFIKHGKGYCCTFR